MRAGGGGVEDDASVGSLGFSKGTCQHLIENTADNDDLDWLGFDPCEVKRYAWVQGLHPSSSYV